MPDVGGESGRRGTYGTGIAELVSGRGVGEEVLLRHALFLFCLLGPAWAGSAPEALLERAVEDWLGERDHWAFTQRAVEFDGERPRERIERYDPSQAGERRWELLTVDGHSPSEAERAAWARKKFRRNPRRFEKPLGDFFDFPRARLLEETPQVARYEIPLRSDKSWLFPIEKVRVSVTVNKQTQALEHLTANVREPFKVLLGIARVLGGDVDLSFLNFDDDAVPAPESTQPTGTARVTVTRFGERVEFTWSDFKRVPLEPGAAKPRAG